MTGKTDTTTRANVRQKIITDLKNAAKNGEYISGTELSNKLKISRAAIWKHIKILRDYGYKILSTTNKGYKLIHVPDLLLPNEIKAGLNTKILGRTLKYYSDITSTNEIAKTFAEHGTQDGTIIIAESQSSGKGRRGRTWTSPIGGLWLSMILHPKISPNHAPILTLLTGQVVARVIRQITNLNAKLKWPNDVRINDKKVCGILTELSAEQDMINYIIIGVGININIPITDFPKIIRDQATSLQVELNNRINRVEFTKRVLEEFELEYLEFSKNPLKQTANIIKTWRKLSDTIGRKVKVETITGSMVGLAAEIAEDGALIVLSETGKKHRIIAGDCIYLDQGQ